MSEDIVSCLDSACLFGCLTGPVRSLYGQAVMSGQLYTGRGGDETGYTVS